MIRDFEVGSWKLPLELERLRNRLESIRLTPYDSAIALMGAVLVYFVVTAIAASSQLWHDELFTYYIAKSPSMPRFWEEIRLDLNPPLMYLAARYSIGMFGDSEYATRLPAIIAFLLGSLCFYRFVSRRLPPVFGLFAVLVFWASPFMYHAAEARPYGLIIGFFGIAMLAWQRALEPNRTRASVLVLAGAVVGMMLSHLFAVFYVLPFCLAELVRWYRTRTLDLPVWASLLLPVIIPFAYMQKMTRFEASVFPPSFQASAWKIGKFYYADIQSESFILLVALVLALLVGLRRDPLRVRINASLTVNEYAFTGGVLAIPILVNLALMVSRGAFFERYAAPTEFGIALSAAFLLAILTGANRLSSAVACCCLLLYIAVPALDALRVKVLRGDSNQVSAIDRVHPELPLVAASGLTFLEMDKYADPATVSRLYYLTDRDLAIRYAHATIFEGFPTLKKYFPIRAIVEPYEDFVAAHPQFLVLGTPEYPEDWLLRRLLDIHATVQYLGDFAGPYKDTHLYEATMPGR